MKRKIILISLCLFMITGCKNNTENNSQITDSEINIKYQEMKDKLIEYGKLVYENEQWLNENTKPMTSVMTLKDLSERNKYDISMFINPKTKKPCDLEKTQIKFIINEVISKENIDYEFEPVLVCE